MSPNSKKGPFLREATGLVREISPLRAMWFNFCSSTGGAATLYYVYSALYPSAPIFGLSPLDLAQILIAIAYIPYGLIFAALLSRMPRTGGDYIFTSRILSPFLGWLETWTLLFANLAVIGFELLQISVVTQAFFVAMGAIYGSELWVSLSGFFSSPMNQAAFGVLLVALMAVLGFTRTRTFTFVTAVFAVLGISGIILQIILFVIVSGNSFTTNFQLFAGVSTSEVISRALNLPGSPMSLEPISFTILGPAIGFAYFNVAAFIYSAYAAGELKGNYLKNGAISILGSIWLYTLVIWIVLVPIVFLKFGYVFIHAWSYLAFNDPSQAPFGGIVPQSAVLGLLASPSLWPLWLYVTVVSDAIMFVIGPIYFFMNSRVVFAWAMDRIIPGWFAEVSEKTATPIRIYLLTLVGGLIFYLLSFPPINLNLASLAYYTILLSTLTAILPGLNAIAMPFRRKDLLEMGPFKRRLAGLPVISWLGVLWLLFILPVYVTAFLQPLISSLFTSPTWQYANSTGVSFAAEVILAGSVIYFTSKYYNKRRGIDVSLIFKEIPPE